MTRTDKISQRKREEEEISCMFGEINWPQIRKQTERHGETFLSSVMD